MPPPRSVRASRQMEFFNIRNVEEANEKIALLLEKRENIPHGQLNPGAEKSNYCPLSVCSRTAMSPGKLSGSIEKKSVSSVESVSQARQSFGSLQINIDFRLEESFLKNSSVAKEFFPGPPLPGQEKADPHAKNEGRKAAQRGRRADGLFVLHRLHSSKNSPQNERAGKCVIEDRHPRFGTLQKGEPAPKRVIRTVFG